MRSAVWIWQPSSARAVWHHLSELSSQERLDANRTEKLDLPADDDAGGAGPPNDVTPERENLAMSTNPARRQRYSGASGALLGFGMLAYVLYVGLSLVAHWIAPGVWGYIGAAGYIALVGPMPALVILRSHSRFMRQWGPLMLAGAATIVVSVVAGRLGWPGWVAAILMAVLATTYVAVGVVRRRPARVATRRAEALLRRHRPAHDKRWAHEDWEWAYTQVGTPSAMREAAFSRARRAAAANTPTT